jgi:HK97 family phage prohead protease
MAKNKEKEKREPRQRETRYFKAADIKVEYEAREGAASKVPVLMGYAAKFGTLSQDLGGFKETIRNGAFKKTILEADIRALFNHDANFILGRNKANTLRLWEDDTGLGFNIYLPDTQQARDLAESIARGDVDQCSFAFSVIKEDWREDTNAGIVVRDLVEVKLFDVSVVTYPAYEDTDVKLRNKGKAEGINYTFIADILARSHKQKISEHEEKLIQQTVDKLRSYIKISDEPVTHSNDIEEKRKRLSLKLKLLGVN